MEIDLNLPWKNFEFVAFDTETSGAYPLGAEIVEFGAVRWKNGQIISKYNTLLKPSEKMSDFIIGIHGITNEMVENAPKMSEKISEIREFLDGAILMAHHAPFDMGFLEIDFEKNRIVPPRNPVLCTSLMSRKLIPESPNHKLQTLIQVLKIDGGTAHRASDDARACLEVGIECFHRLGENSPLEELFKANGKDLRWSNYQVINNSDVTIQCAVEAITHKKQLDIVYDGGRHVKDTRRITPLGLVMNPDGDFVMALCHRDGTQKRFYLNKIKDCGIASN